MRTVKAHKINVLSISLSIDNKTMLNICKQSILFVWLKWIWYFHLCRFTSKPANGSNVVVLWLVLTGRLMLIWINTAVYKVIIHTGMLEWAVLPDARLPYCRLIAATCFISTCPIQLLFWEQLYKISVQKKVAVM